MQSDSFFFFLRITVPFFSTYIYICIKKIGPPAAETATLGGGKKYEKKNKNLVCLRRTKWT